MSKFFTLSILTTFFQSCRSSHNDKKVEGTPLTIEETESAITIRDYFKKMSALSESDLTAIKALDASLLIEHNDTFLFETINFAWAKQFNESMISAYYENPAKLKRHILCSHSDRMQGLGDYLKTDEEFKELRHSSDRKDSKAYLNRYLYTKMTETQDWMAKTHFCFIVAAQTAGEALSDDTYNSGFIKGEIFFITPDLEPLGKFSISAMNSENVEYSTPNYDQDIHLESNLGVDLNENFIKTSAQIIQQLLRTEKVVQFNN